MYITVYNKCTTEQLTEGYLIESQSINSASAFTFFSGFSYFLPKWTDCKKIKDYTIYQDVVVLLSSTYLPHIVNRMRLGMWVTYQRVELHRLQRTKEYWGKPIRHLAQMVRIHLIKERAEFEGRDVYQYEFDVACALDEVMYWVPPPQLEGTSISTLELKLEEICLPCGEDNAPDPDSLVLINECLNLICETRKLDELRVEKLAKDHIEVCFVKNYICASFDLESNFLLLENSRPLLDLADLGDELDVDKLLLEIENPHVENNHEDENIVFYLIDRDRPVVDFVFPSIAFDSHGHLNFNEHFIIHVTSLVKLFDEKSVYFLWTVVCFFAHLVSCSSRRRTKGALAQPFDTYD
ncbi:hypothetical protein YC2023_114090 [Brassica napus]